MNQAHDFIDSEGTVGLPIYLKDMCPIFKLTVCGFFFGLIIINPSICHHMVAL